MFISFWLLKSRSYDLDIFIYFKTNLVYMRAGFRDLIIGFVGGLIGWSLGYIFGLRNALIIMILAAVIYLVVIYRKRR